MSDMTPLTPTEAADEVDDFKARTKSRLSGPLDRAVRRLQDHARTTAAHDPQLIEWLLAMTPGDCEKHEFAVFTEGGAAPKCPWCSPSEAGDPS